MLVFTAFSNIHGIFILIKGPINFIKNYYYRLHLKNSYVSPSPSSSVKVFRMTACLYWPQWLLSFRTRLAYLPMISESANICDFHRENSSREFLVAENEPDQIPNYFYSLLPRSSLKVPFASWGQPETFFRLSGICCTSSAPAPGWSPHSLWFTGLNFAFSLATSLPLSVLVWVKNLSQAALEGISHAALHKIKGGSTPNALCHQGDISMSFLSQIFSFLMELIETKEKFLALEATIRELNKCLCISIMCINKVRPTIIIRYPESLRFAHTQFTISVVATTYLLNLITGWWNIAWLKNWVSLKKGLHSLALNVRHEDVVLLKSETDGQC